MSKNFVTYNIVLLSVLSSNVVKCHVIKCHEKKHEYTESRTFKQCVTDGQAYAQNLTNRSLMLTRFSDLSNYSDKIVPTSHKIPSHF